MNGFLFVMLFNIKITPIKVRIFLLVTEKGTAVYCMVFV